MFVVMGKWYSNVVLVQLAHADLWMTMLLAYCLGVCLPLSFTPA